MTPSADELLRTPLFSNFEDAVLVSQGGQGRVYKVRDKRSAEPRALKLFQLQDRIDDRRWRRELEALLRLSHASIVQLYDSGSFENWRWLVLDWVDGGDLGAAVQARLRLNEAPDLNWTLRIFSELATALCEAHH
jgi:serine/threonine protein kinase